MIQPYEISIELSKYGHNCHFNEDIFDLHHSSLRARFESAMLTNDNGPQNENRMTQPKGSGYKKADRTEEMKSKIFFLWDFWQLYEDPFQLPFLPPTTHGDTAPPNAGLSLRIWDDQSLYLKHHD